MSKQDVGWLILGIVLGAIIPYSMLDWRFWACDIPVWLAVTFLLYLHDQAKP